MRREIAPKPKEIAQLFSRGTSRDQSVSEGRDCFSRVCSNTLQRFHVRAAPASQRQRDELVLSILFDKLALGGV